MADYIGLAKAGKDPIYDLRKTMRSKSLYCSDFECRYTEPEELGDVSKSSFSVFSQNIRSLTNKFDDLQVYLSRAGEFQFTVVALQEIWSVGRDFDLPGYQVLEYNTRDKGQLLRNANCGGGVGLFIKSGLNYELLSFRGEYLEGVYESIWALVTLNDKSKRIIGNIYRPNSAPEGNLSKATEMHIKIIDQIKADKRLKDTKIVLVSDFNANLLNFSTHDQTGVYVDQQMSRGLLPMITKPTRLYNNSATLIDNIFVSPVNSPVISGVLISDISDHLATFFIEELEKSLPEVNEVLTRKVNSKTIATFETELANVEWDNLPDSNAEEYFQSFFDTLSSKVDMSFPLQKLPPRKVKPDPPWFSQALKVSSRVKNKLYRRFMDKKTQLAKVKYKDYLREYKNLIRAAKRKYYGALISTYKNNIKKVWEIVRGAVGIVKNRQGKFPDYFLVEKKCAGGKLFTSKVTDKKVIADGFNKFYSNVGPNLSQKIAKKNPHLEGSKEHLKNIPRSSSNFTLCTVNEATVQYFIDKLKNKSSSGTDGLSNKVLKQVSGVLLKPLHKMINFSLSTGVVPSQLKLAKVIPLYKGADAGSRHEYTNYRPIAILNTLSKVLEKVVEYQLRQYFRQNDLFYAAQYGFRPSRSTSHALLDLTAFVHDGVDNGSNVVGIFIDLAKAFDTLNFDVLLEKLERYGVCGTSLKWFKSYLTDRKQRVVLPCGTTSIDCEVETGVPQGSVLGPLLFIIYINDLPRSVPLLKVLLFADDTSALYRSKNEQELFSTLNAQLSQLEHYFALNKLSLNVRKTRAMGFLPKGAHFHYHDLFLAGQPIQWCCSPGSSEKYFKFLGVLIDDKLTFQYHVKRLYGKLCSASYAVAASAKVLPLQTCINVYRALYESNLMYCASTWAGTKTKYLKQILGHQTRVLKNMFSLPRAGHISPALKKHKLLKTCDILSREQIMVVHSMKMKLLPSPISGIVKPLMANQVDYRIARNSAHNMEQLRVNIPAFSHHSKPRLAIVWNQLPESVKSGPLHTFKQDLKEYYLSRYNLECDGWDCQTCHGII